MRRGLGALVLSAWCSLFACGPAAAPVILPSHALGPELTVGVVRLHLQKGGLAVLSPWEVSGETISGEGSEYSAARALVRQGQLTYQKHDVALVEVEGDAVGEGHFGYYAGMVLVSGASLALTVACALNPKSCFGSCPTFYVPSTDGEWTLVAEGFSGSVARSLEADDIDDLPDVRPERGALQVAMRNEALETHVVRSVTLLVVDGPLGSTVHQRAGGGFDALGPLSPPTSCVAPLGGCEHVGALDGREMSPESDGVDLAARTEATLRFSPPGTRDASLVLAARNSLMSTFVLYHMLALHGRRAGELVAALERRDGRVLASVVRFAELLGGIDVEYRQGTGAFRRAPGFGYTGPLARHTRAVPLALDRPDAEVEVRLRFARAHWRLDGALLGARRETGLTPVEVAPRVLEAPARERPRATERLRGAGAPLVTLPGDDVLLEFDLPARRAARALFLKSRGYYYEWMRTEWLRDEDLELARRYLADPEAALRAMAPGFRRVEPEIDEVFWKSRFAKPARAR